MVALRRGLLLALLLALYFVLWQGPDTTLGRTLFVVHLGLFMLWQPFVHAEQRLSLTSLVVLAGVVLLGGVFLKNWMVVLWIMILAGIVGGKVLLFGSRAPRLFYLMALGFLVAALFLMAVPLVVPLAESPQPIFRLGYVVLPAILIAMAVLPRGQESDRTREVVDFVYSLFVFLLLAVLMLGSLAAMQLLGSEYAEALLQALLVTGAMLLVLGLAWNPYSGFAGLGGLFSRYLMSIGLPIEQWLQALANLALKVEDPHVFVQQACAEIGRRLPWVRGGEWTAGDNSGCFGVTEGRRWEFHHENLVLVLYTFEALSPTLVWHCNLLAQLLAQFHADKERALALKQLSYMRAVHETGARLTHDVKNLLQSLNTLCQAGVESDAGSSLEYRALLQRQLPAITKRLAETLAKLNAPRRGSKSQLVAASAWWDDLRQRMAVLDWVSFKADLPFSGEVPGELFSGVVDNLIRNAEEKRLREPSLRLQLEMGSQDSELELTICDSGSAIAKNIASGLFQGPVMSDSGYGIGLYHAARHAQAEGYRLELTENRTGMVCFRLARERG